MAKVNELPPGGFFNAPPLPNGNKEYYENI
jgi:hypothetical protein